MHKEESMTNDSTNDLGKLRSSRRWIGIQSLRPNWGASWAGQVWVTPDFIDSAVGICDRVFTSDKVEAAIIKVFTSVFRVMNTRADFGRVEDGLVQLLLMEMGEGDKTENLFIGIRRTEGDECYIVVEADLEGSR